MKRAFGLPVLWFRTTVASCSDRTRSRIIPYDPPLQLHDIEINPDCHGSSDMAEPTTSNNVNFRQFSTCRGSLDKIEWATWRQEIYIYSASEGSTTRVRSLNSPVRLKVLSELLVVDPRRTQEFLEIRHIQISWSECKFAQIGPLPVLLTRKQHGNAQSKGIAETVFSFTPSCVCVCKAKHGNTWQNYAKLYKVHERTCSSQRLFHKLSLQRWRKASDKNSSAFFLRDQQR